MKDKATYVGGQALSSKSSKTLVPICVSFSPFGAFIFLSRNTSLSFFASFSLSLSLSLSLSVRSPQHLQKPADA